MRYWLARQGQRPGHFRHRLAFLLTMALIVLLEYGCGAPHIFISAGLTPAASVKASFTPTPTPSPTPVAVPSAAPVMKPAGWTVETSPNWCGYTLPEDNVTGVRAQWKMPDVSTHVSGAIVSTWVGIGGWGDVGENNLVQIGTNARVEGKQVIYEVWYETLPDSWDVVGTISAGDSVAASVTLEPGQTRVWDLSLVDLATQQKFGVTVTYPSPRVSADYIVEDPEEISHGKVTYFPFPGFAPVTMQKADVRYAHDWLSIAAVPSVRVTLVQSNRILAVTSSLKNDTFTVRHA